jgi:hypothetical protein
MTDNASEPVQRATITQVYELIGQLRTEVFTAMADLDNKQEARFASLLTSLESAVAGIRGDFVPEALCIERHEAHDAKIEAAVEASKDDREKLWAAVHGIEQQMKWAAAAIITAFIGLIVYLFQGHIGQ